MIIPFRSKKDPLFLIHHLKKASLLVLLVMVLSYFFLDRAIAQWFTHASSSLYQLSVFLTELIFARVHFGIWPILYFFFRYVLKKSELAHFALFILISIALANAASETLKWAFGRMRPELFLTHQLYGFSLFNASDLYHSLPSGHATTAGAIAGALGCIYPRRIPLFLGLALMLSLTRIILGEHFLSDIIGGVFLGTLVAEWVYRKME
ncbi:MAG: phosphatase PAP2 family protein [Rhabdochlamydiaceae bacterium]|nr:phosphatase PAP2 family protein [Rhabdochlamydiaceae bacterium]